MEIFLRVLFRPSLKPFQIKRGEGEEVGILFWEGSIQGDKGYIKRNKVNKLLKSLLELGKRLEPTWSFVVPVVIWNVGIKANWGSGITSTTMIFSNNSIRTSHEGYEGPLKATLLLTELKAFFSCFYRASEVSSILKFKKA